MSLASQSCSRFLAFLPPSLHTWRRLLNSFFVACPCFHLVCAAFLCWTSIMCSQFSQTDLLVFLLLFPSMRMAHSYAWRMLLSQTCQLSRAPLPTRAALHGIPRSHEQTAVQDLLLSFKSPTSGSSLFHCHCDHADKNIPSECLLC